MKPLEGITVVDLTRLLPGAVATQYLRDNGAEVIKIEQPGEGDYARSMSPLLFARTNAGKKSVTLDLKLPEDKQAFLKLLTKSDILIEGFRPGVMARLGLGFEQVSQANPRLIYVSLSGYGQNGPNAGLAGHDINYIAMGGLLSLTLPVLPGVLIADLVGGAMQSVIGILTALAERARTGRGRHVDISMLAGVESLLTVPLAGGEKLGGEYACYTIYKCRDQRWVAVGALEPKFWITLCEKLGCAELIPLQFDAAKQPELKQRVGEIFATRDAGEWFKMLRDSDCCVTPVRNLSEVAREMHLEPDAPPPRLGQHNHEVLER